MGKMNYLLTKRQKEGKKGTIGNILENILEQQPIFFSINHLTKIKAETFIIHINFDRSFQLCFPSFFGF